MPTAPPPSIPHVVHVEERRGARAHDDVAPSLLVEVPHGADRLAHYVELRQRLVGDLPPKLEDFFCINTDVGAWDIGCAVVDRLLERVPTTRALLVRSLVPRTFIDCNRPATRGAVGEATGGGRSASPITAGIPPYVRDPADLALLEERHARYVETARQAYALCLGGCDEIQDSASENAAAAAPRPGSARARRGQADQAISSHALGGGRGLALTPHTYGPHTLDIATIGDDIVEQLHRATSPEALAVAPLRAEIDLLTRDGEGAYLAPEGLEAELLAALRDRGFGAVANDTYHLHPSTLAHHWSVAYPGRVLCLEVRRDLLVAAWTPFDEMVVVDEKVAPIAEALAAVLAPRLPR